VPELGKKVTLLNKPHRSAGFRVLKAPDMPSILVEMGYLSNPADEAMLRSKEGRRPLIEGIVAAVDRFFAKKQCWT
jgi:N-acetylmuramoyl-L-alanine amidase